MATKEHARIVEAEGQIVKTWNATDDQFAGCADTRFGKIYSGVACNREACVKRINRQLRKLIVRDNNKCRRLLVSFAQQYARHLGVGLQRIYYPTTADTVDGNCIRHGKYRDIKVNGIEVRTPSQVCDILDNLAAK